MVGDSSDYVRQREAEAARLAGLNRVDTDTVRELLILSCHASPLAKQFFEGHLSSEDVLVALLRLAVEDYSGDAQMTASYWVSRFPPGMLTPHARELEAIAANEWDSVAVHARKALESMGGSRPEA